MRRTGLECPAGAVVPSGPVLPFESLDIIRFRGLRGLRLAGFGRLNILVGGNNCGKTSVLEAFELCCDPLSPMRWISVADRRDIGSNSVDRVDNVFWMFPVDAASPDARSRFLDLDTVGLTAPKLQARADIIEVTASEPPPSPLSPPSWNDILRSSSARTKAIYLLDNEVGFLESRRALEVRITGPGADESGAAFMRLIEGERFTHETGEPSGPRVPCASVAPLSHRYRNIHAARLSEAKETGLDHEAVALIQQFDPDIVGLDILARQGTYADLRIRHKRLGLAPLNAFGDGLRRALLYALTLPQVRGGVLLLDEVESAIHVRALGRVFEWLGKACEQFDVQLFVSTHSLEAIDALLGPDEQSAGRIVGFHLPTQPATGEVTRYDGPLLARIVRERGLDVR